MSKNKWDYIFLFGSQPNPRMLEKVRLAVKLGYRVACCCLKRPREQLRVEMIDGCDFIEKPVHFNGVDLQRLLSMPQLIIWLRQSLFSRSIKSCYVHTDSLDLLILAQIAAIGKPFVFHHMVRDLHSLQLNKGIFNSIVRLVDRLAMRRVSMLMLTCEGYFENYYKTIYSGEYVVVENWPDHTIWTGFHKKTTDIFTIGFVGVVRYLKCFKALIAAIDLLHERGFDIRLKIAGGGELQSLSEIISERDWIDQTGAFNYGREIAAIYTDLDLIWCVYDTSFQNVRIAMPNKFYEAILSKTPIVVAEDTYVGSRVRSAGIGTCVPCTDPEAIANTLAIACQKEGWYITAKKSLADKTPSVYLEQEHPLRLRQAVTGTASQLMPSQIEKNQKAA